LEADIQACFDEIEHTPLLQRMRRRIRDKRVLALVRAFLKSGVMTCEQCSNNMFAVPVSSGFVAA
jgi:retron-type reverse transcriptase